MLVSLLAKLVYFVSKCAGKGGISSVRKFLQSQDCRNLPGNSSVTYRNIRVEFPLTDALGIDT